MRIVIDDFVLNQPRVLVVIGDNEKIPAIGAAICGRLRFCKVFLERLGSKQVAVICPACVRGAYDRWP